MTPTSLATVTLVFTDLVGSTQLANRIGPGAAEELRREHFTLLREACAASGGREVKSLGDGLMLAFDSASAAVDASVTAQQAIEARNRRAEVRFEVRIGIALGEVSVDDDDYYGEAVVEAARLCDVADGGQVLVTDIVKLLAEGGSPHEFRSVGAQKLKGLPEPVLAHEVVVAWTAQQAWPLPQRLRGAPDAAYVGREEHRTALQDAWKATCAGNGSLVLVSGEPGIGKSRLATTQAFAAHETGGTVLFGGVDEGLGVPYQPWIEVLGHYVEHCTDVDLARYVEGAGPELARLVPDLRRRVPDLPSLASSDGETERYLLIEAVTRLLREAAARNPVLVVLDDLHWADRATMRLLVHLHHVLADSAVLFVATYRETDLTPDHPLTDVLATLRREDRITRIALDGLDQDELVDLISHASGQESNANTLELARMLQRDTNGNPLFVGEVLRHLVETGHLGVGADGRWTVTTDLDAVPAPDSVREVVAQRVQRLGADSDRVLATAALIGLEFDLDLLAAVLDRPADDLIDVLEAATRASLVTEVGSSGRLRFLHALVAQALVDGLSSLRRAQIHRRIAGAVEAVHGPDLGGRTAMVARHLVAAGDDPIKAIDHSRRAGQHALAALAPEEALRWFRTALDLLGTIPSADEALRCDLLIDVGEATRDAGTPGFRDTLVEAAHLAEALDDGERIARAVLALSRSTAASLGNADAELVQAIEAALARCTEPDATRARLLGQLAAELMYVAPLSRRSALVDEAISIARTHDDATQAQVLISGLPAIQTARTITQRQQMVQDLERLVARVSDPQVQAYAPLCRAIVGMESGDRQAVDRALAAMRAACATTVQPTPRWFLSMLESVGATLDGNLFLGEQLADTGLELAMSAELPDGLLVYAMLLVNVRFAQGRLGELVDLVQQAAEASPDLEDQIQATLTSAYVEAGRYEEAGANVDELLRRLPDCHEDITWLSKLFCMTLAASRCRRPDVAAVLYDISSALPHELLVMTGSTCCSHSSTALGMLAAILGRRDEADAHFARAAEHLEAFGAPLLLASNRYEHGRALLEIGADVDRDRAHDLIRRAAETWRAHDCRPRCSGARTSWRVSSRRCPRIAGSWPGSRPRPRPGRPSWIPRRTCPARGPCRR